MEPVFPRRRGGLTLILGLSGLCLATSCGFPASCRRPIAALKECVVLAWLLLQLFGAMRDHLNST